MVAFRIGRVVSGGVAAVALLHAVVPGAAAQERATGVAARALAICRSGIERPAAERTAQLDEALALAEAAMRERPDDPVAHFAAFCSRGRRLQLQGLTLRVFAEIRLVRAHIERTLELAPDWPDAIAGKGSLLVSLPTPLGGDRTEGQRLLRLALTLDPANVEAQRLLEQSETPTVDRLEQVRTAIVVR
jgi:hypothetical protein